MSHGVFFIIVGPSGVGKTTVVDELLDQVPSSARLVTTTSRPPRPGETDGRDYHFISRDEFVAKRDRGEFLEWNEFCGNLYGSSRVEAEKLLARHQAVFAILDVNGARAAKAAMPDSVTVFILPGSTAELERRLTARAGCDLGQLVRRIERAVQEVALAPAFDHAVRNPDGRLDQAIAEILRIIDERVPLTPLAGG